MCDALQDLNTVLNGRFVDGDGLKAAFQSGILLNMLTVLCKCCRADHLNLAA